MDIGLQGLDFSSSNIYLPSLLKPNKNTLRWAPIFHHAQQLVLRKMSLRFK